MENNELFAEFLGWKKNEDGTFESPSKFFWEDKNAHMSWNVVRYDWKPSDMLFDIDWNWLMEVVEKIESLGYLVKMAGKIVIINNKSNFFTTDNKDFISFQSNTKQTKIEAVYKACVEFIKWYNENKPK